MTKNINDSVSVAVLFTHDPLCVTIQSVVHRGREYVIREVSYAYLVRKGRTLMHVFWAAREGVTFKLVLDTELLAWTIQEIHDHESDSLALQHPDQFDPPY